MHEGVLGVFKVNWRGGAVHRVMAAWLYACLYVMIMC